MAKGQTIEELYIGLGLDADDLKLGFETAGKTVKQAIGQLNNEAKNIKLKSAIDFNNLGRSASELDRIKLKYKEINALLDVQTKKEQLLAAQLKQAQNNYALNRSTGNEIAMNRAQTALLGQQKAVSELRVQFNALDSVITRSTPKAEGFFGKMSAGATKAKGSVSELHASFGKFTAATAATMATVAAAGGLFSITNSAMQSGEALYKLSNRLHTTTAEAGKMNKLFKMAGVDVGTAITFFTRLDRSVSANGKTLNSTQQALQKYGVSLTDSQGRLLPYTKQLEELAKGYKTAAEAGQEEEFAMAVLGTRGQSLIPVLQDMDTYSEALTKVPSTGLLDPKLAHSANIEWIALNQTMGQLNSAYAAAMLPIAKEMLPGIQKIFAELVQTIRDNKDVLKEFGSTAAEVLGNTIQLATEAATALGKVAELEKKATSSDDRTTDILKKYYGEDDYDAKQTFSKGAGALAGGWLGKVFGWKGATAGALAGSKLAGDADNTLNKAWLMMQMEFSGGKYQGSTWDRLSREYDEAQAQKQAEEEQKSAAKGSESKETEAEKAAKEAAKAQTDAAKKAEEAAEAQKAAARAALNKRLDRDVEKLNGTDLVNNIKGIDYQVEDYRQQGASEVNLVRWQEAQKAKIIEDFNREVATSIDSIWKDEYQNRLDQIEQEKEAWEKKGLDEVKATEWSEKKKQDLQQETALRMFKEQYKYLQLYRNAMAGAGNDEEKQMRAQAAIVTQLRRDSGITGDMWTTKDEMAGFQKLFKAAQSGVVPILDENPNAFMWKGTQAVPILPERYNQALGSMEGGMQVIRGGNDTLNFNLHVTGDLPQNKEAVDAMADTVAERLCKLVKVSDTQYEYTYGS